MNISQDLIKELAERTPFSSRVETLTGTSAGVVVRCQLTASERIGCAVAKLERFPATTIEPLAAADWSAVNRKLADAVACLGEPISLLEMDRHANVALLRSTKPRQKGEVLSYFEVVSGADHSATLRRFEWNRVLKQRQAVDFLVTADQFEQLLENWSTIENR